MTSSKRFALGSLVLALAVLAPAAAHAQRSGVELTLFAGGLVPTEDKGLQDAVRDVTRRGSLAGGARLTLWASDALAVEFAGAFSPADVRQQANTGTFKRGTDLFLGAGKLALNLTPGSRGLGVLVSGGAAALRYGASVADPDDAKTHVGGVVGIGLRLPFATNVALRVDAEDFIYRADFGLGRKTVQDLLLSAGLALAF
jgi:hypothetical protein